MAKPTPPKPPIKPILSVDPNVTPEEAAFEEGRIYPVPETPIGAYYRNDDLDWSAPPPLIDPKDNKTEIPLGKGRKGGKPAIFNRYSVFFFNNTSSSAAQAEKYLDSPNRIDPKLKAVRNNPTASAIINWTRQGTTNAVEYAPEDFLWAKKYGMVPNNYLVTLRRFGQPCNDDLFDPLLNKLPDLGRLLTWVDGEDLKWENVGLKWAHGMKWADLEADIQVLQSQPGYGNETGALGKGMQMLASITDTNASNAARSHNPATQNVSPYDDKNKIFGPIDVIRNQKVRDKGLTFEQKFELKFEYQLRSIDGINSKIAFIDLLSNILVVTANKGSFWGGERRFVGGNPRRLTPFGDPSKLASGDYAGYMDSLMKGMTDRIDTLSKGKGFSIPEGIGNMLKSLGGNLMSQITGGALDKMGRPGAQAMNSLLTGEDTGEWHVTVGNPANPIISVGNLALTKTEVSLEGVLGPDDFPTKIIVTCSLEPARPRDRIDMMNMFSRNNRTYLTTAPKAIKYNKNKIAKPDAQGTNVGRSQDKATMEGGVETKENQVVTQRFPNHAKGNANGDSEIVVATANLMG
jgi:hypothetical protein